MVLLLLNNSVTHLHLEILKNIRLEFPSLNSTPLVQPMGVEILKNFKTLYCRKLVNYSLETNGWNLLTSSLTAWEVSARFNLLKVVKFVADVWLKINNRPFGTPLPIAILNTRAWICQIRPILKVNPFLNFSTSKTTKTFYASTIVSSCRMKMEIVRK